MENRERNNREGEHIHFIRPYQEAMDFLLVQINILNDDYRDKYKNYPIHNIQSRIKSKESIFEKLKRKRLAPTCENAKNFLMDIAGIRIICYFETDVYHVMDMLKKYRDIICIKETDYVKNPKPNGYRSYHLVLGVPVYHTDGKEYYPVEIQIRTLTMDLWASMEHRIVYKGNNQEPGKTRKIFLELARELKNQEDKLYSLEESTLKKRE